MSLYRFYLYDETGRLFSTDAIETCDLLDAFEHLKMLIGAPLQPSRVELWSDENFIAHIAGNERRVILKKTSEPLNVHPVFDQTTAPNLRVG